MAFKILIEKFNQDLQLVLVGEEDYFFRRLKAETNTMLHGSGIFNQIIFTGFISDESLNELYSGAKLYVFPSLCEGFGLPPLEAIFRGVPVVSSKSTCLPEILGDAAVYFDAGNPQDIAEKINNILTNNNLAEKTRETGYRQIKKYSWQKMAEETLKIYIEKT